MSEKHSTPQQELQQLINQGQLISHGHEQPTRQQYYEVSWTKLHPEMYQQHFPLNRNHRKLIDIHHIEKPIWLTTADSEKLKDK